MLQTFYQTRSATPRKTPLILAVMADHVADDEVLPRPLVDDERDADVRESEGLQGCLFDQGEGGREKNIGK